MLPEDIKTKLIDKYDIDDIIYILELDIEEVIDLLETEIYRNIKKFELD